MIRPHVLAPLPLNVLPLHLVPSCLELNGGPSAQRTQKQHKMVSLYLVSPAIRLLTLSSEHIVTSAKLSFNSQSLHSNPVTM